MSLLTELNIKSKDIRISVPLRLHFVTKDTHLDNRLKQRNLSEQDVINLVVGATQKLMSTTPISSIKDSIGIDAADKQSCLVTHIQLSGLQSLSEITALIRTTYIFDGKYGKLPPNTLYINEDNPSDKFLEAEQVADWYGHLASNGGGASNGGFKKFISLNYDEDGNPLSYRAYQKYDDSEHKNLTKALDALRDSRKKQQMSDLYAAQYPNTAKTRKKEMHDAFNAHEREKKQLKKQYKKEADADLQRVFKDADSRILTPRGPNGSLRSIDKKAAQRLKKQQEMDAAWKEYGLRDDSTKDKEMNALWSMRKGRTKKDKAAKYHSMQSLFQKHRDFHHKHNKWAHYDLQNALKDADSKILTPRGPNGSLRAIDRKYKKRKDESQELRGKTIIITESQLRDIIQKLEMGIL